jgi:metal-sulfur cluster biosynthetic enzyme
VTREAVIDVELVRAVAGRVPDPEVRTPIAELGLLDEVEVDQGRVRVHFHLTSPLCPAKFAGGIGREIRRRVGRLPGVESVEVVLGDHFMADALHQLSTTATGPRPRGAYSSARRHKRGGPRDGSDDDRCGNDASGTGPRSTRGLGWSPGTCVA